MMRRATIFFFVTVVGAGCQYVGGGVRGSGVAKTETREVETFDEVRFPGAGRLEITVGKPSPLMVTGDDNLLPLISTKVTGTRLTIDFDEAINPKTDLVFKVGTADIKFLDCSGAAKAIVTGVKNEAFKIDLSGAGSVSVSGQTGRFELSISGTGNVDADDLAAKNVTANVSGAGNAEVQATETLKADVSGVGHIRYKGDPKVESSVSGVGSVMKKS